VRELAFLQGDMGSDSQLNAMWLEFAGLISTLLQELFPQAFPL